MYRTTLFLVIGLAAVALGAFTLGQSKPTLVLVHGALFTRAGWAETEAGLTDAGYSVVTFNVPGRGEDGVDPKTVTLESASKKVCDVVNSQPGAVILVGHSQGGALITQATTYCPEKIEGLIYVAAVLPLDGEVPFGSLDPQQDTGFGKVTKPNPTTGVFEIQPGAPIAEYFFQTLPPEDAAAAIEEMVDEPMGIGTATAEVDEEVLDEIPKVYVETLLDKILTPATQEKIQTKIDFNAIYYMYSDHCPMLSQPAQLVQVLRSAALLME